MKQWLDAPDAYLLARDVERCLGSFDAICPPGTMNAGIRGLPPSADLKEPLAAVLEEALGHAGIERFTSEIEEQGLQAAAMCRMHPLFFVDTEEVTICSPFWPRSPDLGTCGAHFVGMNAAHIPWNYYDRPADLWLQEHWERMRPLLYEKAGLVMPAKGTSAI